MLQICVNGQLLLAMLAERLSLLEGVQIIQANTDGVTVYMPRNKLDEANKIARLWEKLTSLELEDVTYSKMVISNVNNYAAQYENGKIKEKGGLYQTEVEYHKNKSQRIVRLALREYFFNGVPIRQTIENHIHTSSDAIYDYCLGRKVQWNQQFVLYKGVEEYNINQKVIRYYITRDKATMMKKYNDGRIEAVNKGYNARLFQDYEVKSDYAIDYEYYINEAYKVTTPFDKGNPKIGMQLSLFD